MAELEVTREGVALSGEDTGGGEAAVVLLHGLTATRRYVVMGSSVLARAGLRVIAYDARGHGRSTPARDPAAYGYDELAGDLAAILDATGVTRALLAGASMGAHTALSLALTAPARVAGLVIVTPAYDGTAASPARLARWDALAEGLRTGGIEGFLAAYDTEAVPERYRETVARVIRQRLAGHAHAEGVADALSAVPRSRPFGDLGELGAIRCPTAVVASSDEADPEHPRDVGVAYADAIPGARLVEDEPGHSPVAWQGSQLSRVILEVAGRAGLNVGPPTG